MRYARWVIALLMLVAWTTAPLQVKSASPVLLRDPYLTDVSGSWAMVSLGTDTRTPAPVVSWGPANGNCATPPNAVTSAYVTSFVDALGTTGSQFKAQLLGLQANTAYCYRVSQAGVDLLGVAPVFTSALASGAADPFTFAVVGDWGGGTSDEAKVMAQIANARPSFVVTTGDNVYNSGTQAEYGGLNGGNAFAPQYWPLFGRTTPGVAVQGNHGFSGSLPAFQNWPADSTVAACAQAGCRYQRDTYCCTGALGSTVKSYPSAWYAFDWGNTRFYVLSGAWSDSYGAYQGDFQAHFNGPVAGCQYCGAELAWLTSDLASHPSAHKFAFFHYPLYSDSGSQTSDTYLEGPQAVEGVLASYGVNIVFNGHAHQYERNYPQIPGSSMLSYITGGGGDPLGGVSRHSSFDAYAQAVYHYLRVAVNGSYVTVTPIDENGATFDVQTYNFPAPAAGNDFSIATSPSSVSLSQGQSTSATVSTALTSGTAQAVTLSASGLPAGATASFNPSSVTAGGSSTLTITTSTSTPAGSYTVTVTGTGTSASHSASIALTVLGNDFSISVSPTSLSVTQGQSTTATVSTAVVSGSAQTVTLSASGLPAGATASFSPSAVTAGGTSTMTVSTTSSTPGGTYTVTVTGTGGSATHTAALALTVTVTNDFSIATSPGSVSVSQGQSTSATVSTAVVTGTAQTVSLSASGLPAGATASFNPSSVTAGGSATLTISTSTLTPAGSYTVTVTGTGTSATHNASMTLTVVGNDFSISVSPTSLSVLQGQSTTATVSTAVISGTAQTVTLSASGLPASATASFSPSTLTAGGSSTMTVNTTSSTPRGTYTVAVTGTGTSATRSASITVIVTGLSSGPQFVQAIGASESASSTTLTATFAAATQPGDLLVLSASVYTGLTNQINRVTDSAGNTWTKIGSFCTSGHFSDGELWYAPNAAAVTSVTVTVTTATVLAVEVAEFSGVAAVNPLDGFAGTSNTGTAANSGSALPTGSSDLAVAFIAGHGSTQAIAVTSTGFSTLPQKTSSNAGATPASVIVGYQVLNSTAAQNIAGSFTSGMYWAAGIALFKSA